MNELIIKSDGSWYDTMGSLHFVKKSEIFLLKYTYKFGYFNRYVVSSKKGTYEVLIHSLDEHFMTLKELRREKLKKLF